MRIAALAVVLAACHQGAPRSPARTYTEADLASPDQATRDAAAAQIRTSWTPPSREPWDALLAKVHEGDPLASVVDLLPEERPDGGMGSGCGGGGCTTSWQLDDRWMLTCGSRSADDTIISCKVVSATRMVHVEIPDGFTGTWVTYFVSGAIALEATYRDGHEIGTFTVLGDDGNPTLIHRYDDDGVVLEEIGYHAGTTQMTHQGKYTDGQPSGVWTFYNLDGSVSHDHDYSATP